MRKNKILAAAIASALSLGAGNAFAAASPKLVLLQPAGKTAGGAETIADFNEPATAPKFSSDLLTGPLVALPSNAANGAGNAAFGGAGSNDRHFIVGYKLDLANDDNARLSSLITITATLNGGSWGTDIIPLQQAQYCNSASLTIAAAPAECNKTHTVPVSVAKSGTGGTTKDQSVSFTIRPNAGNFNTSDWFYFSFDVDDLVDFAATGAPLTLDMEASYILGKDVISPLGTKQQVQLASFVPGTEVTIRPADEPPIVKVDVGANSLQFKKDNVTSTTTVQIGVLSLQKSSGAVSFDGSSAYNNGVVESTLTITGAPFSASRNEPGMVFLDIDPVAGLTTSPSGDGIYTKDKDVLCTVTNDTMATCKLSGSVDPKASVAGFTIPIMLTADGKTEILPQEDAPIGLWEVQLGPTGSTGSKKPYESALTHITSNGTKCTLYNIPDEMGGLDAVSIRVTNKNTKLPGKIFGEIVLEDGTKPYGSKPLELLSLEASQTVRLFAGDAVANANANEEPPPFDLTFGGKYSWPGQRARLIITSTLVSGDVEALALVRNKLNSGPGMNMSTGATGTGCK
jgi:hypothetical protein